MERPVGDKFKINGCVYVVVEDAAPDFGDACGKCTFSRGLFDCLDVGQGRCTAGMRKDMKNVHFEHFGVDF